MAETHGVEDYLEAIYVLTVETHNAFGAKLAEYLGVSRPTVSQTLGRLQRDGLVQDSRGRTITLTPKGLAAAETIVRRHRLAERWAADVLGLDWVRAHEEADKLEHAFSPEVEERLWESLGRPSTCPHGNPIPGLVAERTLSVRTLAEVPVGEEVVIDRIYEQMEGLVSFLSFLGVHGLKPGAAVRVEQVLPSAVVVRKDGQKVAIERLTAAKLLVRDP